MLAKSNKLIDNYWGSFYLTWISLTTIGFGDFVPISPTGKAICIFNSLVGIFMLGGLIVSIFAISVGMIKPFTTISPEEYEKLLKEGETKTGCSNKKD